MDNNQNLFPNLDPNGEYRPVQPPTPPEPPRAPQQPAQPYSAQPPIQPASPYAQQPPQPMYSGPYAPAPRKNGKAIAGMVLGIVALFFTCFYYTAWLSLALSITGLVLSLSARKVTTPETGHGMATAGMICSIIALCLSVIFVISCVACVGCAGCAALSDAAYYGYYY